MRPLSVGAARDRGAEIHFRRKQGRLRLQLGETWGRPLAQVRSPGVLLKWVHFRWSATWTVTSRCDSLPIVVTADLGEPKLVTKKGAYVQFLGVSVGT